MNFSFASFGFSRPHLSHPPPPPDINVAKFADSTHTSSPDVQYYKMRKGRFYADEFEEVEERAKHLARIQSAPVGMGKHEISHLKTSITPGNGGVEVELRNLRFSLHVSPYQLSWFLCVCG